MGAGKTMASIHMMNSHPEKRYIFITPYLAEAERIKNACPDLHFVEPSNRIQEYGFTKTGHAFALVQQGRNIATTHQAFLFYTAELLDMIREQGYTLVIDESVNTLESMRVATTDVVSLVGGGYLAQNGNTYTYTGKPYERDAMLAPLIRLSESRTLVSQGTIDKTKCEVFYWVLPTSLFRAFENIYILTYLFHGQPLYYYLQMNGLAFEYMGLERTGDRFRFRDGAVYVPDYVHELQYKIIVCNDERLNKIGDEWYSLSKSWYEEHPDGLRQLKSNIASFFNYANAGVPSEQKMWGTFNIGKNKLKGKGYASGHVPFNARATNDYRGRKCLVYPVNVFMNVGEKLYYKTAGVEINEDVYALSVLIQWIWRSAIRDGHTIQLYVPSRRMRTLLLRWIETLSNGGDMFEAQIL